MKNLKKNSTQCILNISYKEGSLRGMLLHHTFSDWGWGQGEEERANHCVKALIDVSFKSIESIGQPSV